MGLFDIFKKKNNSQDNGRHESAGAGQQKTRESFDGTAFERDVVTFQERKRTAVPSARGLYPAEILLMSY